MNLFKKNKIMAYIKFSRNKIGTWVTTSVFHESCDGCFTIGSKVKIIGVNPIRGYDIEDEKGNRMYEIGWRI